MSDSEQNKLFTIPNLLSLLRIGLIPVFVLILRRSSVYAGVILALSGFTDILDGWIARRFHMVSNMGKILDPLADKLTLFVCLLCLTKRQPLLILPVGFLLGKECLNGLLCYLAIRKCGVIHSARWHGKLCTVLLYALLFLHLLLPELPIRLSYLSVALCCIVMFGSFLLYAQSSLALLLKGKEAS